MLLFVLRRVVGHLRRLRCARCQHQRCRQHGIILADLQAAIQCCQNAGHDQSMDRASERRNAQSLRRGAQSDDPCIVHAHIRQQASRLNNRLRLMRGRIEACVIEIKDEAKPLGQHHRRALVVDAFVQRDKAETRRVLQGEPLALGLHQA